MEKENEIDKDNGYLGIPSFLANSLAFLNKISSWGPKEPLKKVISLLINITSRP